MIGRALNPGPKDRFQWFARFVDENSAKSCVLHAGEVWLITLDRLFPLGSLEKASAAIG